VTDPHDELTPAERRAFEALPRERPAPPSLEDRIVALLRSRGELAVPLRPVGAPARRWQPAWLVGAVAASLALFATGFATGQYLGARSATIAAAVGLGSSLAERTQYVERTGSEYVAALATLIQERDTADAAARTRATQAALDALGAAAREVARLAPDDPLAAAVLRGLTDRRRASQPPVEQRAVVWY
jgi:hypothetical protein